MNRYCKLHRYAAITVLVCFLTALTGVAAFAAHDCCGKCVESLSQRQVNAKTTLVSDGCCPVKTPAETTCACSFQKKHDRDQQVYSVSHVNTAYDDRAAGLTDAVTKEETDGNGRQAASRATLLEIRIRSGPLYLTNQSFLC